MPNRSKSRPSQRRMSNRQTHEEITHNTKTGEKHTVRHTTETATTAAAPEVAVPLAVAGGAASAGVNATKKVASAGSNAVGTVVQTPVGVIQSHSHEGVLIGSLTLLMMATWAGFWKPTIVDTIWNGKPWHTTTDGRIVLGGVVFCIVLAMIADSSNEAAEHFLALR